MNTVIDNLVDSANIIKELLKDLLLNHSSIYLWNKPGGSVRIYSFTGNYAFNELDEEGRRIQSQILEKYHNFFSMVTTLLKAQPDDTLKELSKADNTLARIIEQKETYCKDTQEAYNESDRTLQLQLNLLGRIYDASDGLVTFVPDTNALIFNPDLDKWRFDEINEFTIVILPTVLGELDLLKDNHRKDEVRKKAKKLIRMLKEYRRRGKLSRGVTLVKGISKIQAMAIEPDMNASLPWLDPESNDDRILTGVIEVMRSRPRSPVIAVSCDINFQNKAEFAGIPFIEPPECTKQQE